MDSLTLENFRCFYKEQTVTLAPLTLLVGENSTGKTSFMAMVRILWDSIFGDDYPDFKEKPYDLGSFDDIAHNRGGSGRKAKFFRAGFTEGKYSFQARFEKNGATPVLVSRSYSNSQTTLNEKIDDKTYSAAIQTKRGSWLFEEPISPRRLGRMLYDPLFIRFLIIASRHISNKKLSVFIPSQDSPNFDNKELEELESLQDDLYALDSFNDRPFSGAPVRSRPQRTYDPSRYTLDSEGDTIPMYLSSKFFEGESSWKKFKSALENFGSSTGLFDEIEVKPLSSTKVINSSNPFQLQVRKYSGKSKGPWKNIVDVGYGISQTLPIFVDLAEKDASRISLLQQPEIHLHPSAQATLATLLCQQARKDRQFIIETHSDFIIDRVRMEVRDGTINQDDVSLLYFERAGLDVKIHYLRYDKEGNVAGAPQGYRKFFLEELNRALWAE